MEDHILLARARYIMFFVKFQSITALDDLFLAMSQEICFLHKLYPMGWAKSDVHELSCFIICEFHTIDVELRLERIIK